MTHAPFLSVPEKKARSGTPVKAGHVSECLPLRSRPPLSGCSGGQFDAFNGIVLSVRAPNVVIGVREARLAAPSLQLSRGRKLNYAWGARLDMLFKQSGRCTNRRQPAR
jgi:hypothetical protein